MFVIYENATQNEKPLERTFFFATPARVRVGNRKTHTGNMVLAVVAKGEKVYADQHPKSMMRHPQPDKRQFKK